MKKEIFAPDFFKQDTENVSYKLNDRSMQLLEYEQYFITNNEIGFGLLIYDECNAEFITVDLDLGMNIKKVSEPYTDEELELEYDLN